MRTLRNLLPLCLCLTSVIVSCEAIEEVSDVPEIQFKSFILGEIDSLGFNIKTGELVFSFIDGDADIGIPTSGRGEDTLNLFLLPFKKTDMVYDSLDMDIYGRQYAVLNDEKLIRIGQNKTIKGEIKVQIYYFIVPPFDTMRYDFYITDRAGHKSNVESTSDIGFW
ncbi:MAG: hypothetical protein HGA23_09955 [Bacteroidales bacterium]|nr:hypothetical protein [Bacteroidales bacterium]